MDSQTPEVVKHCCKMMEFALAEEYLQPTLVMDPQKGLQVLAPRILGPTITPRGSKRKPSLMVNFCPFCGANLEARPAPTQAPDSAQVKTLIQEAETRNNDDTSTT